MSDMSDIDLLASVLNGTFPQPRRIMLYGTHGIGKSTFAAQAPGTIFISTEDGLGDIDCSRFPLCDTFGTVLDQLESLCLTDHDFQTIAIDTLDWLEKLVWKKVCDDNQVDNIEKIGYAKGYKLALNHWRAIIDRLAALRRDKHMSCILIAHSTIQRFDNPDTESYDRYTPNLHKHASAMIQEWCDEILFASYCVHVKQTEEGFGKKKAHGIGTGERILKTTERPSHIAKNRLNLPDEIELDWDSFSAFLPALS